MSNKIATREAYGKALVKLGKINDDVVVLDAEGISNQFKIGRAHV